MQIAKIVDNEVTAVQVIQRKPFYNVGRWWDLRDDDVLAEWMIELGYQAVVSTPRPTDDSTNWELSIEDVEGVPTEVWTPRAWTAEELTAREQADAERARIETHEAILDATAALMADAHTDGDPWVQPTAAHDAYPLGITVTHDGKTWESITPANVWAPGVSGWREVVSDGGVAAWVMPTGAHDAYQTGDRVTHNNKTWVSTHADNVWEPGVFGWGEV